MAKIPVIEISGASVKVMRSYDYCHFEINLSHASEQPILPDQVDEMRKEAMRLADKAVEQYKIARKVEDRKGYAIVHVRNLKNDVLFIEENIPEGERSPEQIAKIKALDDYLFQSQFEYDYEDDFEDFE